MNIDSISDLYRHYTNYFSTIDLCKHSVQRAVNDAMVMLYWTIGKYLVCNSKAEYGQKVVEEPIALILCAEKSQQTVELLELDRGNIRVGQYLTKMPPKKVLEQKLLQAIEHAKENQNIKGVE